MNKFCRIAATINSPANPFHLKAYLFHSTPVLERRKRTQGDPASSFRSSPKKSKRLGKQSLFGNVNDFAEHLFQRGSLSDKDEFDENSSGWSSWFRTNFRDDGFKRGKSKNKRSQKFRRNFEFCDFDEDDVEFETIFRSAFGGGNRHFSWSFTFDDDEPRFRNSSGYYSSSNFRTSSNWRYEYGDEYDFSSESEKPMNNMTSDRLALGLNTSGPLNLEDVKNAYRACALKWHPDRHQGSSKVAAEEKFKACSAAYQSLCNKLALN
ncbi:hypothetical protein ACJIZ3_025789 [Penstemon smallii]|uniref:J domain-containing protein n=1 Tax=Penstemon smallii TaxID=265156 RepID=A0ABD3TY26_9LAMI